ncbi:metal tolerance protein 11 [Biomphalaria pfeifferi]|uniref:Metal tolerance protein 11 n=1 Tax=Biomphalaria pfeifferi TaxID=112525 RepID=A0AAD8BV45_BIOPF|nr:metal tolerance protein 11 [Biomphalaria pfeifferi]
MADKASKHSKSKKKSGETNGVVLLLNVKTLDQPTRALNVEEVHVNIGYEKDNTSSLNQEISTPVDEADQYSNVLTTKEIALNASHPPGDTQKEVSSPVQEVSIPLDEAVQYNDDKIPEIVPKHSTILTESDEDKSWKMPVDIFSSKKQSNYKKYSKRLKSYYKAQDELISAYEEIIQPIDVQSSAEVVSNAGLKKAALFSKITLFINFLLLVGKAVASVLSGSISIISSLLDSCLDLVGGSIMWWATRAVKRRDPYDYPQGRTKIEPVAIIILSVFMWLCSAFLIREAIEKIVGLSEMSSSLPTVQAPTFAIAGSTVAIKLILFLVCRKVNSPIVQALAQDHRNDVMSNSVAIVFGYLGSENFYEVGNMYGFSYLDPIGAMLISLYIMYNWTITGREQMKLLTGHTARPDFISKLTWICFNHHPLIQHIDTVRAFHFGNNFLVEVDIILPMEMTLKEAHDIGESLQSRLENVAEVERAFVHLDYEFTHKPYSEHKRV